MRFLPRWCVCVTVMMSQAFPVWPVRLCFTAMYSFCFCIDEFNYFNIVALFCEFAKPD